MEARILIVDDDAALLFAFNKIFRNAGYEVDSADTIDEAKKLIDMHPYQVIITDLKFDANNQTGGYEIIKYVKHKAPETITVLLTAFEAEDLSPGAIKPDFYLKKPVKFETISEIIHQIGIPRK
jgi:DNA-binding NtrC family response regulator